MGCVICAQKSKENTLVMEAFEASDVQATNEYFNKDNKKWYRSDFDAEVREVSPKEELTDTQFIENILTHASNYKKNEKSMPIPYPGARNIIPFGNPVNSNSFTNSVLIHSNADSHKSNFFGRDPGRNQIIPKKYFDALKKEVEDFERKNIK